MDARTPACEHVYTRASLPPVHPCLAAAQPLSVSVCLCVFSVSVSPSLSLSCARALLLAYTHAHACPPVPPPHWTMDVIARGEADGGADLGMRLVAFFDEHPGGGSLHKSLLQSRLQKNDLINLLHFKTPPAPSQVCLCSHLSPPTSLSSMLSSSCSDLVLGHMITAIPVT